MPWNFGTFRCPACGSNHELFWLGEDPPEPAELCEYNCPRLNTLCRLYTGPAVSAQNPPMNGVAIRRSLQ